MGGAVYKEEITLVGDLASKCAVPIAWYLDNGLEGGEEKKITWSSERLLAGPAGYQGFALP